jgi:hypothetical protein
MQWHWTFIFAYQVRFNPTERCMIEFNGEWWIKFKQQESVYLPDVEKGQQSVLNSINHDKEQKQ